MEQGSSIDSKLDEVRAAAERWRTRIKQLQDELRAAKKELALIELTQSRLTSQATTLEMPAVNPTCARCGNPVEAENADDGTLLVCAECRAAAEAPLDA